MTPPHKLPHQGQFTEGKPPFCGCFLRALVFPPHACRDIGLGQSERPPWPMWQIREQLPLKTVGRVLLIRKSLGEICLVKQRNITTNRNETCLHPEAPLNAGPSTERGAVSRGTCLCLLTQADGVNAPRRKVSLPLHPSFPQGESNR